MSNFKSRLITGSALVLVMVTSIWAGKYTFLIFFGALTVLCLSEFYRIFENTGKSPQKHEGIAVGLLVYLLLFLISCGYIKNQWLLLLIPATLYIFINELYRKSALPFENIAVTLLGIIYIAIPIALLWPIAYRENIYQYNPHLILGYFVLIWTYDSMAYVSGLALGRRKLFERISPKKSWEGAIGGLVFACVAGYVLSLFFTELSSFQWVIIALLVSVFGTFGDLFESLMKRSVDIKDSGNILPGHGGLLDRFDALFLAVPAIYVYLQFV